MSTLNELFERNPLDLTNDDITEIIKAQRANRRQFNLGFKKAGSAKKSPKKKEAMDLAEKLNVDDTLTNLLDGI